MQSKSKTSCTEAETSAGLLSVYCTPPRTRATQPPPHLPRLESVTTLEVHWKPEESCRAPAAVTRGHKRAAVGGGHLGAEGLEGSAEELLDVAQDLGVGHAPAGLDQVAVPAGTIGSESGPARFVAAAVLKGGCGVRADLSTRTVPMTVREWFHL